MGQRKIQRKCGTAARISSPIYTYMNSKNQTHVLCEYTVAGINLSIKTMLDKISEFIGESDLQNCPSFLIKSVIKNFCELPPPSIYTHNIFSLTM